MNKYNLYQQAYGNDSYWKEGYYNAFTNTYITLDYYNLLKQLGDENLDNYKLVYPVHLLEKNWKFWEKKPQYIENTLAVSDELAGVILGWGCDDSDMLSKLDITQDDYDKIFQQYDSSKINYLAELFVNPIVQGLGIGSQLLDDYIESCKEKSLEMIVTRTTTLKDNPQKMFLKKGFNKIYEYPEGDQRSRALYSLLIK